MSLLFDQNLSRRLVGLLAADYPGSEHVEGAGLLGADDLTVWRYAAGRGLMVVSKDSDFRHLALLHGPPPKVIWLRVENGPTAVAAAFAAWACAGRAGVRRGPGPGIVGAAVVLETTPVGSCKNLAASERRGVSPTWM